MEHLVIEYPAIVKSTDKALVSLGGLPAIAKIFQDTSASIELKLRPGNPFAHPIQGITTTKTRTIICKIVRRRSKGDSTASTISCTLIRPVSMVTFRESCDFQYSLPPGHISTQMLTAIHDLKLDTFAKLARGYVDAPLPDLLPPPCFTRLKVPLEYRYKQHHSNNASLVNANSDGEMISNVAQRRGRYLLPERRHVDPCPSGVSTAPEAQHLIELNKNAVADFDAKLTRLNAYFSERPVWLRGALLYALKQAGDLDLLEDFKLIIPFVGYTFTSGPWRATIVKYGHDPLVLPEDVKYQIVDIRMTRNKGLENFGTLAENTYGLFDGKAVEGASHYCYQLCDLIEPSMRKLVEFPCRIRAQCEGERYGWVITSHYLAIKGALKEMATLKQEMTPSTRAVFESKWFAFIREQDRGDEVVSRTQTLMETKGKQRDRLMKNEVQKQMGALMESLDNSDLDEFAPTPLNRNNRDYEDYDIFDDDDDD